MLFVVLALSHGPCVHSNSAQFTNAEELLRDNAFRNAAADRPWSTPAIHTVLRRAFCTDDGEITVFDLALADFICSALLRGVNLRERYGGDNSDEYNVCVREAKELVDKTITTANGKSMFRVIEFRVEVRYDALLLGARGFLLLPQASSMIATRCSLVAPTALLCYVAHSTAQLQAKTQGQAGPRRSYR